MFRIDADHSNHSIAVNDLALVTDFFYRSPDFHWPPSLFVTIDNSAPGEVVRREFDGNLVSGEYPNKILSHFPGNVSQHHMFAFQFDPEHGIRQRLKDGRDNFDCFFFGHALVA